MNYLQLANTSALYAPLLQIPDEIVPFMEFLDKQNAKSFLEIGVCMGGTYFLWSHIVKGGGIKLGIELKNGPWGAPTEINEKMYGDLKRRIETMAPNSFLLYGNSSDKSSIDWVDNKLGKESLDFIFIDGDHSYEGVKRDYYNYLPFVKEGGFIAMHDIKDTQRHREAGCTVGNFWKELKGDKIEFVDNTYDWGGIGVVKL